MDTARDLIQDHLVGDAVASGGYVVLVADEQMRFLAASRGACELLGYTRDEIVALTVPEIVVEQTEAIGLYEQFLQEREQRGEIVLRRKDGSLVTALYHASKTRVSGLEYYVSVLLPTS